MSSHFHKEAQKQKLYLDHNPQVIFGVTLMSVNGMVLRIGQTMGPLVMGVVFMVWGTSGTFYMGAVLAVMTFFVTVLTLK